MNLNVLRILVSLRDGPSTASEMLERIEQLDPGGIKPPLATFYRELKGALDAGLVRIVDEQPQPGPGRPRQTYAITPEGQAAARREAERLEALAAAALAVDPAKPPGGGR